MNALHRKLEQLQQTWSTELVTFHELQKTHKALNKELRECVQKLDAQVAPAGFKNQNV